jgi:hypothetical protein
MPPSSRPSSPPPRPGPVFYVGDRVVAVEPGDWFQGAGKITRVFDPVDDPPVYSVKWPAGGARTEPGGALFFAHELRPAPKEND